MIQRKQTLWLLLAIICTVLTLQFPFYNGTIINGTKGVEGAELTTTDNIFLLVLTIATAVTGLLAIFLFKDRKRQFQLTFAGLVMAVALIGLAFYYTQNFQPGGRISLTALFYLFSVAGFFMALRGIRADQKLIRDLNRLR